MTERPIISEEHDNIFEELDVQYIMDIIGTQYDLVVEKEMADNPAIIGHCGFPCDGECLDCKTGTFDINDEV
jgi:hypothetical protein